MASLLSWVFGAGSQDAPTGADVSECLAVSCAATGRVIVVQPSDGAIVRRIAVGARPGAIAIASSGRIGYVARCLPPPPAAGGAGAADARVHSCDYVSVVDIVAGTEIGRLHNGPPGARTRAVPHVPTAITLSPGASGREEIFVAWAHAAETDHSEYGCRRHTQVTAYDAEGAVGAVVPQRCYALRGIATVPQGPPRSLVLSPDAGRLLIAHDARHVAVLDVVTGALSALTGVAPVRAHETLRVMAPLPPPPPGAGAAVDKTARGLLLGASDELVMVMVADAQQGCQQPFPVEAAVRRLGPHGGVGRPAGLCATRDGRWLLAASADNDQLIAVRADTGELALRVPVGPGPSDVVTTGDSRLAFVASTQGASITRAEIATGASTEIALDAGCQPRGLALAALPAGAVVPAGADAPEAETGLGTFRVAFVGASGLHPSEDHILARTVAQQVRRMRLGLCLWADTVSAQGGLAAPGRRRLPVCLSRHDVCGGDPQDAGPIIEALLDDATDAATPGDGVPHVIVVACPGFTPSKSLRTRLSRACVPCVSLYMPPCMRIARPGIGAAFVMRTEIVPDSRGAETRGGDDMECEDEDGGSEGGGGDRTMSPEARVRLGLSATVRNWAEVLGFATDERVSHDHWSSLAHYASEFASRFGTAPDPAARAGTVAGVLCERAFQAGPGAVPTEGGSAPSSPVDRARLMRFVAGARLHTFSGVVQVHSVRRMPACSQPSALQAHSPILLNEPPRGASTEG